MTAATTERGPDRSAVDVGAYVDPRNPESWSRQMVALIRDGHYREGYEILAEKMPFVENMLRPYAEHLAGKENAWTHLFKGISRFIDRSVPQRILDVGCGIGPIAMELAQHGHQTWGIDVLEPMIERGRELAASLGLSERVRLVQGDIRRLEQHFDADAFDTAVACDVFEHLDDPSLMELLDGLYHVVRPGGTVIVHTSPGRHYYWFEPNRWKLMTLLAPMSWLPDRAFTAYVRAVENTLLRNLREEHTQFYRHEYGHINCMDPVHLHRLMEQAGLTSVRTFAEHTHRGFKDEGCLRSAWTRRLFDGKSVAARNVFGVATVPDERS